MGQKINPLGFRLGITQEHKSVWYTDFNQYGKLLREDAQIRAYLNKLARTASISNIKINRNGHGNNIQLNIETGRPGILVGKKGLGIKNLLKNIKKLLLYNHQLNINIIETKNSYLSASLIGDLIVKQLEDRIAFRRAMRVALQTTQSTNLKGIKIQVSGRLNGADIARSEWLHEGRVPLHTLRANIDYCTKEAHTIYGVFGIKIWLFKNEIITK